MLDVALVTCLRLPEPDPDQDLLLEALTARGLAVAMRAWDDPGVDWGEARLSIIRSTWNYYRNHAEFLRWAARAAAATRLHNPLGIIEWNSDKSYLGELAARGIAVVPTEYVARGAARDLGALMDQRGWSRVVVKPRVSAGSFETHAWARAGLAGGELAACAAERDVMVQPYLTSVEDHGERALIFVDGEFTHAVRKRPRFAGGREGVDVVGADDLELGFARSVLAAVAPLLYARVDLARAPDGQPMLMELEALEPSLFLRQSPPALERFTEAIVARSR